jgi:hypothetical protein
MPWDLVSGVFISGQFHINSRLLSILFIPNKLEVCMGEWMERHEAVVKKPSTERATVSIDKASQKILKDLGVEFKEVKVKK